MKEIETGDNADASANGVNTDHGLSTTLASGAIPPISAHDVLSPQNLRKEVNLSPIEEAKKADNLK